MDAVKLAKQWIMLREWKKWEEMTAAEKQEAQFQKLLAPKDLRKQL